MYAPVELAQNDARDDYHDRVGGRLDIFTEPLDDTTIVDEYVRIDYDIEISSFRDGKCILSVVSACQKSASLRRSSVWRTCISTSFAAWYNCSTVLSYGGVVDGLDIVI